MAAHVVHVIHQPKSGIGTFVRQLVAADDQGEFKYSVVLLQPDPASVEAFQSVGANVVQADFARNGLEALRAFRALMAKADIVHAHSFLPSLVAAILGAGVRRHVRTIHNSYPYFSEGSLRSVVKRLVEGWALKRVRSHICCVAENIKPLLPRSWHELPVLAVPNGVLLEEVRQKALASTPTVRPAAPYIVNVCRLDPQKNVELLVEAFSEVVNSGVAGDWQLLLVGDGPTRAKLECLVSELGMGERVRFAGFQSNPYPLMAGASLFASSSAYEGFQLAPIEAMALRLPVVLTRVGGLPALLSDGRDALVVESGDRAGFAAALARLIGNETLRSALACEGQRLAESRLSMQRVYQDYRASYACAGSQA